MPYHLLVIAIARCLVLYPMSRFILFIFFFKIEIACLNVCVCVCVFAVAVYGYLSHIFEPIELGETYIMSTWH